MPASVREPKRNEACSCGSGKKYKSCCLGKKPALEALTPWPVWGVFGLVLVSAAVWFLWRPSGVSQPVPPATPDAWEYDPVTNRHWDPDHGHWHDGLPPSAPSGAPPASPVTQIPLPDAAPTPAPWTYDPATDKHWDPGHGHWHDGPPPPEAASGPDGPAGPRAAGGG